MNLNGSNENLPTHQTVHFFHIRQGKMTKKYLLGIILSLLCLGNIFGQNPEKNLIAIGQINGICWPLAYASPLFELFLSYERAIIPQYSFSVNISGQFHPLMIFHTSVYSDDGINSVASYSAYTQIHYYPDKAKGNFAGFHVDVGTGFNHFLISSPSIILTSGIGYRFIKESEIQVFSVKKMAKGSINIGLKADFIFPLNSALKILYDDDYVIIPFPFPFCFGITWNMGITHF